MFPSACIVYNIGILYTANSILLYRLLKYRLVSYIDIINQRSDSSTKFGAFANNKFKHNISCFHFSRKFPNLYFYLYFIVGIFLRNMKRNAHKAYKKSSKQNLCQVYLFSSFFHFILLYNLMSCLFLVIFFWQTVKWENLLCLQNIHSGKTL